MLNINQLREETPGTLVVNHFNNAGTSLPIKRVVDIITEYLHFEATYGGYETHTKFQNQINEFYSRAAHLLNCQPDEIAIAGNASDAANKALYAIPFEAGDIILTTEYEYGNNYLNYLNLKKTKGIEVQVVPCDDEGNGLIENMEKMISPKVKLIAATHIPTNSGFVAPVEAIGAIAQKHNILL